MRYAAEKEMPLYSALMDVPETLSARPRKCVSEFGDLMNELVMAREDMGVSDFVKYVIDRTGLKAQYERDLSDEGKNRLENIEEFWVRSANTNRAPRPPRWKIIWKT